MTSALPAGSKERMDVPLARGLLDYFPSALAEIAKVSKAGNDKHNPGEDMHHARGKSMDHADCILRHLVDRGRIDPDDGMRHSAKVAWRALALLQEELEAEGAPLARAARVPEPEAEVTDEDIYGFPFADSHWVAVVGDRFEPPEAVVQAVNAGRFVEIEFRSGPRSPLGSHPSALRWDHTGGLSDIVAYRIRT
jgi:hypothetical protein